MNRTKPGLADSSGFQIRTRGHIGDRWSHLFESVTLVQATDGTTVICCPDVDQAALHGLLRTVRDLGLSLIAVTPIGPECDPHRTPVKGASA